ncbi:MAG: hypothetical protein EXS35_05140 [Pedosphaera sp.]|nr:hypothetical protein [Pedosphaera sp.]
MKRLAGRLGTGLVAAGIATAIWVPSLHFFFTRPAVEFRAPTGLSTKARQLANRHLELWRDPKLRDGELKRMRASNAEWDFMGRSFLVWSLANIGLRDPAEKTVCLETMDRIIDETLRLEKQEGMCFFLMSYAKPSSYVVQPARSLFLDGEVALMLAARRLLEEKPEYKPLLAERVSLMATGLRGATDLVLESYPNECWMFDHCVALAALRAADHLDRSDHSALIRNWIAMAKQKLVHPESGLLVASFTARGKPLDGPEGSTLWFVCHCLQVLDDDFARDQYERARKELGEITAGFAYAHEWPRSWNGSPDIDSGPIIPVFDISAGSSGLAFIGASAFQDEEFLASLAATLDFAAFPSRRGQRLKYCASNQVGDAALLYAATLGPLWEKLKTQGAR